MNDSDLVLSFLYLAKERYQFTPKEAAKDLFKRYKGRINELVYIDAIKTVLKDDVIKKEGFPNFWEEDELRSYLESFLNTFEKLCK